MKIGIVGNREGFTYNDVRKKLNNFRLIHGADTIITGGAEGVDSYAMKYAKEYGIRLVVHYPDVVMASPICYFQRNREIVFECDFLIAFNKKEKSGTTQCINTAKRYGVKVIEIN